MIKPQSKVLDHTWSEQKSILQEPNTYGKRTINSMKADQVFKLRVILRSRKVSFFCVDLNHAFFQQLFRCMLILVLFGIGISDKSFISFSVVIITSPALLLCGQE